MERIIKIYLFFLLLFINRSILASSEPLLLKAANRMERAAENAYAGLSAYGNRGLGHIAQDIGMAYALGMGITVLHELGHALVAKLFYGSPVKISIGASPESKSKPMLQGGGFKLRGFYPLTAYASVKAPMSGAPLKRAAIFLAGPMIGSLTSLVTYKLLSQYAPLFYLTRSLALFGLYIQTLGINGITGLNVAGTDAHGIKEALKEYSLQGWPKREPLNSLLPKS